MNQAKPVTSPLFTIGDLVKLRGFGVILVQSEIEIAIVTRGPYSFKALESYHDLVFFEWWCYDILIGSSLITMMPENFLVKIEVSNNEKNI